MAVVILNHFPYFGGRKSSRVGAFYGLQQCGHSHSCDCWILACLPSWSR